MSIEGIYSNNPKGERGLIASILIQAIDDMLAFPHPDLSRQHKYRKDSAAYHSLDARRFVDANNPEFSFYCGLLDLDPKATEEGIYKFVRKQASVVKVIKKPKVKEKRCSANTVTILNHLLSELLMMMYATLLYVEGNVCAAA